MWNRYWRAAAAGALLWMISAPVALAQDPAAPARYRPGSLWEQLLSTILFSLLGVVLAIVGFKLFDVAIHADLEKEICEKHNLAAAILAAAVILGTCVIVAVVVLS